MTTQLQLINIIIIISIIIKSFWSPLYSVTARVAQSIQCLDHWLAVRGTFIQFLAANESFSTKHPDALRDPLSSLFDGYRAPPPLGSSGWHVKLTTHSHLVEKKTQLNATKCFIVIIICSTRFGYSYAHHQELEQLPSSRTHSLLPCT